jgi:hypothetical protein
MLAPEGHTKFLEHPIAPIEESWIDGFEAEEAGTAQGNISKTMNQSRVNIIGLT